MRLAPLLLLALAAPAAADEGMWPWLDLQQPLAQMQRRHGAAPTTAVLERARRAALRAGGCSATFVSGRGLALTNHHCASGCLEEHSTPLHDLLKDGFYAARPEAELRCSGLPLEQLQEIRDVSAEVQGAAQGAASDDLAAARRRAAQGRLERTCTAQARGQRCEVVGLYQGGRYHLYRYRQYTDVRLVFAPEAALGDFGGDVDNFRYPRHALDLAFLRAYEDGRPVAVAEGDRMPLRGEGPRAEELVLCAGNPYVTQRLYTVAQLEVLRDVVIPLRLRLLGELRGMLVEHGRAGAAARREVAERLVGVENAFKVFSGRQEALADPAGWARKVAAEQALRGELGRLPEGRRYVAALDALAQAQGERRRLVRRYMLLEEGRALPSELFEKGRWLWRWARERGKRSDERLREYQDPVLPVLRDKALGGPPLSPALEQLTLRFGLTKLVELLGPEDPTVRRALGTRSPESLAQLLVARSQVGDALTRRRLWDGPAEDTLRSADPLLQLVAALDDEARRVRGRYEAQVEEVELRMGAVLAQGRFALRGTSVYPDATGSPRLTYGVVRGLGKGPAEEAPQPAFTTLRGLFEKATGQEPFVLPPRWLAARAALRLDTPLNFISTLDVTGGNSGSAVWSREGQVVGLVFDGNLPSLGGAFWYDEAVNRTVAVHPAGMLEALRKVYQAEALLQELAPGTPPRPTAAPGR